LLELLDRLLPGHGGLVVVFDLRRWNPGVAGVDGVLSVCVGDVRGELGHNCRLLQLRRGLVRFVDGGDRMLAVPVGNLSD
jgi:hypothetical protein